MIPYEFDGLEALERLGEGGFGEVYLCSDAALPTRHVAVKVLNPSAFVGEADPERRFVREVESLFRLKHRAIVTFHGTGVTRSEPARRCLIMDYVPGEVLSKAATAMDFSQKAETVVEILDALEHAHSEGVLHRDMKPSNVIIRRTDGQPVIVDFGFAYVWDGFSSDTLTSYAPGSLGYIPAEVAADPKHRAATHDVYSAGVILYEIIAGKRPNIQRYEDLTNVAGDLAGVDFVVRKALAPEPERYQTAADFRDSLREWLRR